MDIVEGFSLVLAGLLAGEELIIRYGVQPALSRLPDHAHLLARQALVRRLRVVVPMIMVPTVLLAVATLVVGTAQPGLGFRAAGVALLLVFLGFSFLGTVPINIKVNDWRADRPPADWKAVVARWERIDVFRSGAAILAFAALVVAALSSG